MDESSKICGFFLRIFFGKWILFSKVPSPWNVGIFLLRFARKNLEETNAAVRIRNHVATSTISEKAVAFLFSAKFQLCEDVLQVELHNSFRLTSRFYPDSRRRLRLFFSIPTVCIVLFILFKTLFHLYPQGVKLSWPTTPVSFFGLACLYQQVTALENLAWLGLEGGLELTRDPAANGQTSQGIKLLVRIKCDSVISRSRYYLKTRVPSPIFVTGTTLRWVLVLLINFIVRYE